MLSNEEVQTYLERMGIDERPAPTAAWLDRLVYAHQTSVPFETVGLHRSGDLPDLSTEALFDKIVTQQKGGYCFELNKLFTELLATLGFDARPCLCRSVGNDEGRMPINHRGVIATVDGRELFVDVGFGGPMPAGALELKAGCEQLICGDTFIAEQQDRTWWTVERITRGKADFHDDDLPVRRQVELEVCTAVVEDVDFDPLNVFCSQPGTLFRDHELVNLRTADGHKALTDGVLTLRSNGRKTRVELAGTDEVDEALFTHFGLRY